MRRLVAVKVGRTETPELVKRFLREMELSGRLSHPNILSAYHAGESEGTPFLIYKWVSGRDLGTMIRTEGAVPPEKALAYVLQAAHGLEHAHANGVVHRDVKPSNLLLAEQETVLVSDFGLARFSQALEEFDDALFLEESQPKDVRLVRGNSNPNYFPSTCWTEVMKVGTLRPPHTATKPKVEDASITQNGMFVGTPHYMAPEQSHTSQVDRRADVYGLGCSLFTLLTAHPLYERDTITAVIRAHRLDPIPSLAGYRHRTFSLVDPVLRRMVAKRPQERYQSMTEAIEDLDHVAHNFGSKLRIFISCRRDDAFDATDRLYTELVERFGEESVMMDVDSIPSGADYRKYIQESVENCEVLLAVIGNHWLNAKNGAGTKRLDDLEDFVRIEIALALSLGKPIIPVLVGRAAMPAAQELPEALRGLAYRNAAELRAGRDYGSHVERLTSQLKRLLNSKSD